MIRLTLMKDVFNLNMDHFISQYHLTTALNLNSFHLLIYLLFSTLIINSTSSFSDNI
jgi:hypothetical protein